MLKLLKTPGRMELALVSSSNPQSAGLQRARALGVTASDGGLQAILDHPDIKIVFDATSSAAHVAHAPLLKAAHKIAVDLTPAAQGPYVVPSVNLMQHLDSDNVNLITCAGQGTIPLVYAITRITPVSYAEIVSSAASRSAGRGTRQNIDEFTFATARGLESIGGAMRGKAIVILNAADPPIIMRNTVYAVLDRVAVDEYALVDSIARMVHEMQAYVPGYRLKGAPSIDRRATPWGERAVVTALLEIEGMGDFLEPYAGNLDIMTSAAHRVGDSFAARLLERSAAKAVVGSRS
jgi:acetaldehyde dehydrogenase